MEGKILAVKKSRPFAARCHADVMTSHYVYSHPVWLAVTDVLAADRRVPFQEISPSDQTVHGTVAQRAFVARELMR
jgi:hypothetical protein